MTKIGDSDRPRLESRHGRFQVSGCLVPRPRGWHKRRSQHTPRRRLIPFSQMGLSTHQATAPRRQLRWGAERGAPPGSPEYREAQAALAALQAVLPQTKSAAAATALAAAGESAWSGGRLATIASRLAPLAVAAAPAAALAAPLIALPKIVPGDETIPLGDGLRARRPIGQRSVLFEQRVKDGLLGTSVGAKWEQLPPVDATFGDGLPGSRPVLVDADQLRGAIGAEAADRLLATGGVIDRRAAAIDDAASRSRTAPAREDDLPRRHSPFLQRTRCALPSRSMAVRRRKYERPHLRKCCASALATLSILVWA